MMSFLPDLPSNAVLKSHYASATWNTCRKKYIQQRFSFSAGWLFSLHSIATPGSPLCSFPEGPSRKCSVLEASQGTGTAHHPSEGALSSLHSTAHSKMPWRL